MKKKFKKRLAFSNDPCYNNKALASERKQMNMGVFPSGQRGQTVNLLRIRFGGSNPPAPTKRNPVN